MPIRLCACGFSGAMRTALRACTSASARLPLPSRISASSLVATRLLGSSATMRRISASAAVALPCALRISYRTDSAPGRSGASSSTSRQSRSAVSVAPWRCACHRPFHQRDEVARRLGRRAGAKLQAAAADGPKAAAAGAKLGGGHAHAVWFWHDRCAGGKAGETDTAGRCGAGSGATRWRFRRTVVAPPCFDPAPGRHGRAPRVRCGIGNRASGPAPPSIDRWRLRMSRMRTGRDMDSRPQRHP